MHARRRLLPAATLALSLLTTAPAGAASAAPAIVFASETCELGSIVQGEQPTCEFAFTNGGTADLRVLRVEPSCGCTLARLSSPLVRPGGRGVIRVGFDSANFAGEVVKTVDVESNDAARAVVALQVKARVEPEVDFEPRTVTFDDVRPGAALRQTVMITNRRAEPVRILRSSVEPAAWTCVVSGWTDASRPLAVESWDRVPLEVRFSAPPVIAMPISGECLLEIEGPRKRHFRLKLLALPGQ